MAKRTTAEWLAYVGHVPAPIGCYFVRGTCEYGPVNFAVRTAKGRGVWSSIVEELKRRGIADFTLFGDEQISEAKFAELTAAGDA